ncbi:NAD(P)H-quinone oxidoreductase [Maribellus maritimus]|uniref:NAD(P)H-quinone oxidoreductase n=1 Tax=Maribellus maritimus TaxID=2870838 RepID=UPI001EEA48EC|nr:NAD(P)H-quinone oxidoreductase [Maribellus maritimus]MCG6189709.1 NAD(P)H-quinone oxidoreductase [Maribellus maritimus]
MHAILINKDKSLVWSEVPDPKRRENEVIIDVHAAALNRADLMQREGNYPPPQGWPKWMGLEVAGEVIEVPKKGRWRVGDKVCALLGGGGYAEKVAVPANMILPIPEGLSMVEATAIPEAFATSYLNLCIEGEMKFGDTVFIQAGASGLGMAAIQVAKEFGAKVVTTVGSEEKLRFVSELGADVVINRRNESIPDVLSKYSVDVALDCVAGPELGPCLEKMAYGGRWIVIATLGGSICELNMLNFFKRGVKLIGSTLRNRTLEMKAEVLGGLERQLWPAFSSGKIKVLIYKTLPITQVEEAHAILQNNENTGKVVVLIK